ncbi:2-keto-4-pentenoate hydratase [Magnetospira sp. QH-2]|uniref:2-keto-4-pentenoate hydratase n=1 Tax=Magnetospira sp. (strain QH-2) TaxID=1288970 RepID=UPI0003E81A72|nr:fumarylacetoacetate hydrolase family protein [Magnetospira sp. QH-2]CCQ72615.1 4-oxalocrotonate decarboxylase [Magnetospira sp. QH-2]
MTDLAEIAEIVDGAAHTATAIAQFSDTEPLSVDQAYAVQALSMQRRYARGEKRIGIKMGMTSRAKMVQMGLHDMIWGRLTDAMRKEEGGIISMADYVHPRVEPEVAFLIGDTLAGDVTPFEALACVDAVAGAMEIIDSRYDNFKFDLGDVLADNSSSSGFVIGDWQAPDTDIRNLGLIMSINDRPVQIGSTAAILGNPIRSLVAAARMVAAAGEKLYPGDIVLAGGATIADALAVGDSVKTEFQTLGTVAFKVGE